MPRTVDIVVPVYNEEACIDEFYARVERLGYADALIFVDNASTDGTLKRIERHPGLRVIRHTTNEGYGASVRHGIAASDAEFVIIIDADLEYPPESIPAVIGALREHPVVYCSRFLGVQPPAMPLVRRLGNRLVSALCGALFRLHTTDLYTGMKGFQRRALPLEMLARDGFEHGVEIAALITLSGHRIKDLPVEYVPRQTGRSKMRHVPETLKLVYHIFAYWFRCIILARPLNPERNPRGPAAHP